ncbi:MAG TPA: nitroreductase/quinone reductase family protein [Candidatus Limnocylindrales bacterium]|jgi:deazaflavin-dependent oxidoreductase (nitroreductase family)
MIPPRWVLRAGWALHRALFAVTGGRVGTEAPCERRPGTLFLVTIGRRSGERRRNAVFYTEDGLSFVVVASNAGAAEDPGWWKNLQAHPDAEIHLGQDPRPVRGRRATPAETARLWPRLVAVNPSYEDYRAVAGREIPVVILEPR